ncbi:hypothetical protein GUITHDRAFT_106001 [Guillardia theta CCMP2712]|uniref:Uncharacterized protein n=1 Tax=Guillardia theta (strain CCMP2712) TaxID=905079 RepID=L1JJR7_GUITC|nr:hypothetical protein GUITHDRAFT_106001 [Guillardia theta CCMP2712]EKX48394.1 hypothetical protein GUITHDRAFT_106001 [Guillardia theta CCMP2712]|eukprot:XP_005835374.1 hypothetical protein GUITHDRAFT_106001 [Guillardia theta CCMP2712]
MDSQLQAILRKKKAQHDAAEELEWATGAKRKEEVDTSSKLETSSGSVELFATQESKDLPWKDSIPSKEAQESRLSILQSALDELSDDDNQ